MRWCAAAKVAPADRLLEGLHALVHRTPRQERRERPRRILPDRQLRGAPWGCSCEPLTAGMIDGLCKTAVGGNSCRRLSLTWSSRSSPNMTAWRWQRALSGLTAAARVCAVESPHATEAREPLPLPTHHPPCSPRCPPAAPGKSDRTASSEPHDGSHVNPMMNHMMVHTSTTDGSHVNPTSVIKMVHTPALEAAVCIVKTRRIRVL